MTQLVMKEYKILRCTGSLDTFNNLLNQYIDNGWVPHGPPACDATTYTIIQAMVRFEEKPIPEIAHLYPELDYPP